MFEKEAIRHAFEDAIGVECLIKPVEDFTYEELSDEQQEKAYDFKKGAEFGYSKANEWHNVKDGNPNNENDILCQISKDEAVVGYYHTVAKRYITIDGQDLYNVIAWKEIVLPKE